MAPRQANKQTINTCCLCFEAITSFLSLAIAKKVKIESFKPELTGQSHKKLGKQNEYSDPDGWHCYPSILEVENFKQLKEAYVTQSKTTSTEIILQRLHSIEKLILL